MSGDEATGRSYLQPPQSAVHTISNFVHFATGLDFTRIPIALQRVVEPSPNAPWPAKPAAPSLPVRAKGHHAGSTAFVRRKTTATMTITLSNVATSHAIFNAQNVP